MTSVPSPTGLAHLVQVVGHGITDCRAECLCGWAGPWCNEPSDADVAATEHRQLALGPVAGIDGVLSTLLDLQDDLADVVSWLVANWSVDLPVPRLHVHGPHRLDERAATLTLSVHSETAAQTARLAHLLCLGGAADHSSVDVQQTPLVRETGAVRLEATCR